MRLLSPTLTDSSRENTRLIEGRIDDAGGDICNRGDERSIGPVQLQETGRNGRAEPSLSVSLRLMVSPLTPLNTNRSASPRGLMTYPTSVSLGLIERATVDGGASRSSSIE